jgi:tetratricopeptide (TPR) repeat protein
MANRALAADVLGTLAARRYDYAASAEYASKAELAGERYVAFNPADLNSWVYWVRGKDQLADTLLEQGRVQDAIAELRSAMALEDDERAPAGVATLLNFMASRLAVLEARMGQSADAEASLKEAVRMNRLFVAVTPSDSMSRKLEPYAEPAWRARLQLLGGDDRGALAQATAAAAPVRQAELPAGNVGAPVIRANFLRQLLTTVAVAALRLERYAQAESASRERLELPADQFSGADPVDESSRARVMLAHAVVKQDRAAEAREILQPALEHYRAAQKAGAVGLTFRRDFAYALYVSAIAAAPAERGSRDEALAEAARLLAGQSPEARRLADVRELAAWIAAARGGPTPTV